MAKEVVIHIRCSLEEKVGWEAAAKDRGLKFGEWVRRCLSGLGATKVCPTVGTEAGLGGADATPVPLLSTSKPTQAPHALNGKSAKDYYVVGSGACLECGRPPGTKHPGHCATGDRLARE